MAKAGFKHILFFSLIAGTQFVKAADAPEREVVDSDPVVTTPKEPTHSKERKTSPKTKERVKAAGPTVGQKQDQNTAYIKLAERLADLYACVPGHKDPDYSTQSWYLVDSFMAWNNAVAASVFSSSDAEALGREAFEKAFRERVKLRLPALENDAAIADYAKSAALATEKITQSALKEKAQITEFSKASTLLKDSSRSNGKNIFQILKTAHNNHLETLKKNTCAQLGVSFFASPKFGVPSTAETIAAAKVSAAEIQAKKRKERHALIDKRYTRSDRISTDLPYVKQSDRKQHGYYTIGKFRSGRPHIIGNILKAASDLKEQGIAIAVHDINARDMDPDIKKVKTPGYFKRERGTKATFLTVGPDGSASSCGFTSSTCYSEDKTFEMIKALIDLEPDNIRRIEIADKYLRKRVEEYLVAAHRYKGISANWTVRDNSEFKNAINFEWKE